MAVFNNQITITTSAQQIVPADVNAETIYIHAAGTVYLGDANVTSSNGYRMDSNDKVVINNHETALFAVASAGTSNIYIMSIQK
jgi:hypothetical protein